MTRAHRLGGVAAGLLLLVLGQAPSAQDGNPATEPSADELIQRGDDMYQYWCATCHGAGPGHPGTAALAAKYNGERPALLEERTDLTPQAVRFFVRTGISIMPFFRKTEVSDADLDAIAEYLTRPR